LRYSAFNQSIDAWYSPQVLGQNGAGKLLTVAVPYPRLTDFERADSGHQITLGQVAIPHHNGLTIVGSPATVSLQILLHFVFDCRLEHLAGAFGNDLFQRAFGFNFCSLRERDDRSFFHSASLSMRRVL
jgi:hypothetical protein